MATLDTPLKKFACTARRLQQIASATITWPFFDLIFFVVRHFMVTKDEIDNVKRSISFASEPEREASFFSRVSNGSCMTIRRTYCCFMPLFHSQQGLDVVYVC